MPRQSMNVVTMQWKSTRDELVARLKDLGAQLKSLPMLTRAVGETLYKGNRTPVQMADGMYTIPSKAAVVLLAEVPDKAELREVLV